MSGLRFNGRVRSDGVKHKFDEHAISSQRNIFASTSLSKVLERGVFNRGLA